MENKILEQLQNPNIREQMFSKTEGKLVMISKLSENIYKLDNLLRSNKEFNLDDVEEVLILEWNIRDIIENFY